MVKKWHISAMPIPALQGKTFREETWALMRTNLLWVYSGAVSLEYQTVPLQVPGQPAHQVAWLVRQGRIAYEGEGRIWRARAGQWMFPVGNGIARFSCDARLLSLRFQLEWPSQRAVIVLKKTLVTASEKIPRLARAAGHLVRTVRRVHGVADIRFRERLGDLDGHLRVRQAFDRWLLAYAEAMQVLGCSLETIEETEPRIELAARLVRDHPLDQPLREIDLAAQLGMSIRNLNRLYSRAFGHSPHADFETRRISRACTWLAESDRSAKDITYSLGFSSPSHFTRWFRRRSGFLPTAYRRQWAHRNGEKFANFPGISPPG